jgi:hypothetical protein
MMQSRYKPREEISTEDLVLLIRPFSCRLLALVTRRNGPVGLYLYGDPETYEVPRTSEIYVSVITTTTRV